MNERPPTESLPADPPPAPASAPVPGPVRARGRWPRRAAHWLGELTTVFVGVYAAFLINNHATHRQERQRREQLLIWMEDHYKVVLNNARAQVTVLRGRIDDFNARTAAGQTPEIKAISWQGDYDPADATGLLQSGGYDLLDIETIRDLRDVESTLRQLVSIALHAGQRSDALILPNLGKDPATFYDPATHRLRQSYEWVPKVYDDLREGFEALQSASEKLLAQVRAERARER